VSADDLERLEARMKSMNAVAKVYRTKDSVIEVDNILHVGGFNLDRAMEVDTKFLEPEYPFEWAGIYDLAAGTFQLALEIGPDPAMNIALFPVKEATPNELEALTMDAVLHFSEEGEKRKTGQVVQVADTTLHTLQLNDQPATYMVVVKEPGLYALFTQHLPSEFQMKLCDGGKTLTPVFTHEYKPKHEHDNEVTSVGIETPGDLDPKKLNAWLGNLLRTQGPDIFRMKGVLSLQGEAQRFVFQGVHMLFDGRPDKPWGNGPRHNSLIFIGRNLDRVQLNEGFRACLV
jgi:G3E family GTPase